MFELRIWSVDRKMLEAFAAAFRHIQQIDFQEVRLVSDEEFKKVEDEELCR